MSERDSRTAVRSPRAPWFSLQQALPRHRFLGLAITVFATLLIGWWAASASGLLPAIFMPSPRAVVERLIELAGNGTLAGDVGVSLMRIAIAFLVSTVMAITLGVLAGSYGFWRALLEPLVDFVRYMPVVAFVPLTILWTGTGEFQKLLVIWIGTFFQQVLMVMDAARRVPDDYIGLARTLGMSNPRIVWKIVLPSSAPDIWDSTRICLGWAWTWLVLAELVAANSGMGYRITVSQRYFETGTIIGYILLLGAFGLIADQLMRGAERLLFRYRHAARS